MADRLLLALRRPMVVHGEAFRVGGSIGIAVAPDHATETIGLLRCADLAMYSAKRARVGRLIYARHQVGGLQNHHGRVVELHRAIERGQIDPHYQPVVEATTGRAACAEALARWMHPREGMLLPRDFLALADHAELTSSLGLVVLRRALCQQRAWRDSGLSLPVAVNLTPACLSDPKALARLEAEASREGTPAGAVVVEVAESSLMARPRIVLPALARLHAAGFGVALDDFGAAGASSEILSRLPLAWIKVERAFVRDSVRNARDASIVREAVDLAHALGTRAAAAGVEDAATLELLASWGCDLVQGFHVAHPMSANDLHLWCAREGHVVREAGPSPVLLPLPPSPRTA
jgi:EAL domain-containing protein (putative c-di-GMP-specific phosphodiesterase class I)